jgi:uncharacterized protein with GYD domain
MGLYVSLCNWTEQGIRNVKQTTDRLSAAKQAATKYGVKIREVLYTVGKYDFVVISEAPDEETMSRFMLATGAQGNVRTVTMRAFTPEEMTGILGQI